MGRGVAFCLLLLALGLIEDEVDHLQDLICHFQGLRENLPFWMLPSFSFLGGLGLWPERHIRWTLLHVYSVKE